MRRNHKEKVLAMLLALGMVLQSPMASIGTLAADIETSGEQNVPGQIEEDREETPEEPPEESVEMKEEQPAEMPEEQPPAMGSAKITIRFSDEGNLANRREMEGNKLFHVYADGVRLEEQPVIALDDETPQEMYGMQTYTYTIQQLPLYKEDGVTAITYTVKQSAAKGYQFIPTEAIEAGDETGDMITLQKTDKEEILQADKTFGNYLPAFAVAGQIIWPDERVAKAVRPEMEAYFQTQFTILRNGEAYEKFRVEYAQDEEDANCWNYTVKGLFTSNEDGSAAEYTVQGGSAEGFLAANEKRRIAEDNKEVDFIYQEEQSTKLQTAMEVIRGTVAPKKTVTKREGKEQAAVYFEDNAAARPDKAAYKEKNILLSFTTAQNETYYIKNDAAVAAGKLNLIEVNSKVWTDNFGSTSIPEINIKDNTGTYDVYTISAPTEVTTTAQDAQGGDVTSTATFTWKMEEYWNDTASAYLNPVHKEEYHGLQNVYLHFKKANFTFQLQMFQGTETLGFHDFTESIKLFYVVGNGEAKELGTFNEKFTFTGLTDEISATAGVGNPSAISVSGLPLFTEQDEEITYYVQGNGTKDQEDIIHINPNTPLTNGDYYEPQYDNAKTVNFGSNTTQTYQDGTLKLTLRGETSYKGEKLWLDDGKAETIAARPEAELFLWRYTKMDDTSNYHEAVQVSMPDNGGNMLPLSHKLDNTKNREEFHFDTYHLPKYNPEGFPYVYLTRETLKNQQDGNRYEQVFVEEYEVDNGKIIKITEETGRGNDKSIYKDGILANRITGNTNVYWRKLWKAAAYQNDLQNVAVDLELYRKGTEDTDYQPTGNLVTIDDFRSEKLLQEGSASVSKYDTLGMPVEYQWREVAVREDGRPVALTEGDEKKFTLSHNDKNAPGNAGNMSPNGKDEEWYVSSVKNETMSDPNGEDQTKPETVTRTIITNTLKGKTTYTIDKLWAQLESDGSVKTDTNGKPIYGKIPPSADASATVKLYQDGITGEAFDWGDWKKENTQATLNQENGFYKEYEIPKYDENGIKYQYMAKETASNPADWHVNLNYYVYDKEQLPEAVQPNPEKGRYFDCQMKNAPVGPGKSIKIQKEWKDGGDEKHRETVQVAVFRKAQAGETKDHFFGLCTLTKNENWQAEFGVTEKDVQGNLMHENLGLDQYYIREVQVGASKVSLYDKYGSQNPYDEAKGGAPALDVDGDNNAKPTVDEVEGEHHTYEVTYLQTNNELIVRNRRIGHVNVEVKKNWIDGDEENDSLFGEEDARTEMLKKAADDSKPVQVKLIANDSDGYSGEAIEIGDKTVTIKEVHSGGVLHIKDGNTTNPADTTSVQAIKKENDVSYYFYNLPKYDAQGKVIHYSVEEENLAAPYQKNIRLTSYQYSNEGQSGHFASDHQLMEITNRRVGTKNVEFYKHWIDKYVYETLKKRPDIYLDLYKRVGDTLEKADYVCSSWKAEDQTDAYNWKWTYESLPKYDEKGKEIQYYAVEQSKVDMKALEYQPVQLKKDFGSHTAVNEILYADKGADGTLTIAQGETDTTISLLPEKGTFVNQIAALVQINGKKVWKNIPSGFPDEQLPKLKIILKQLEDGAIVKETEATSVTWVDVDAENHVYTFYLDKVGENAYDANSNPKPDDAVLSGRDPLDAAYLPKYNEQTGGIYAYEVTEKVVSNEHEDTDLDTTYEELPGAVHNYVIENTYDVGGSNVGELHIQKEWKDWEIKLGTNGKYPILTYELYRVFQYTENGVTETSKLEKVEPKTYDSSNTGIYDKNNDDANIGGITFKNLPVYAPNGVRYWYYAVEKPVEGYEAAATSGSSPNAPSWTVLDGNAEVKGVPSEGVQLPVPPKTTKDTGFFAKIADFFTGGSKATASPELEFTNTYTATETITLKGGKTWEDYYNNTAAGRPKEITLSLYRYAKAQSETNGILDSQTAQLMAKDMVLSKDTATQTVRLEQGVTQRKGTDEISIEKGTNDWSFQITGLDQYAPNGAPWTYKIVEATPIAGYHATTASVEKAAASTEIELSALKNTGHTRAGFSKTWDDGDNTHSLRPVDITVKLQLNDGNGWKDAYDVLGPDAQTAIPKELKVGADGSYQASDGSELPQPQKQNVTYTKSADKNQWGTWTLSKLPAGIYDGTGTTFTPYQYRFVEMKIGETAVAVASQADGSYSNVDTNKLYEVDGRYQNNHTAITNKLGPDLQKSLEVTKIWDDSGNAYDSRPMDGNGFVLTFYLQRRLGASGLWEDVPKAGSAAGSTNDSDYVTERVKQTDFTQGAGETYTCKFENLPKFTANSTEYQYRASEESTRIGGKANTPAGYTSTVTNEAAKSSKDSNTITNSLETIELAVSKVWKDGAGAMMNGDSSWMTGRTVVLELQKQENGTYVPFQSPIKITLDGTKDTSAVYYESEPWKALFTGLPKYQGTSPAKYRIVEVPVPSGFFTSNDNKQLVEIEENISVTKYEAEVTNQQTEFKLDKVDTSNPAVSITDQKTELAIYKKSDFGTGTTPVAGAEPIAVWERTPNASPAAGYTEKVTPASGSSVETTTAADGSAPVKGLPAGTFGKPAEYVLYEKTVPNGYEKAALVVFQIDSNGSLAKISGDAGSMDGSLADNSQTLTLNNSPITMKISKVDFAGMNIAEDKAGYAEFTILGQFARETASEINGLTSENVEARLEKELIAGEEYTVTETKAPNGYIKAETKIKVIFKEDGTIQSVTCDPDNATATGAEETLTVINEPIELTLKKVDVDDNTVTLAGAKFELTDTTDPADLTRVLPAETDIKGTFVLTGTDTLVPLIQGHSYELVEISAPYGYYMGTADGTKVPLSLAFTVEEDGKITQTASTGEISIGQDGKTVLAENRQLALKFQKADADGAVIGSDADKFLAGAEFTVTGRFADTNDRRVLTAADTSLIVRADAPDILKGRLAAGETYTVSETKTPDGYETAPDFQMTVATDGASVSENPEVEHVLSDGSKVGEQLIIVKDNPIEISILKTKEDGTATLKDAEFTLEGVFAEKYCMETDGWNKDESRFEWTSTETAKAFRKVLIAGNTYTLTETQAPNGYVMPKQGVSVAFTVTEEGKLAFTETPYVTGTDSETLVVKNHAIVLSLTKADIATKQPITGRGEAAFKVTPEAGKTFADGSTTEITVTTAADGMNALTSQLVPDDEYTMTETTAPTGYQLAAPFTFKVDAQGKIKDISSGAPAKTDGESNLTVYDQTIDVKLRKVSTEDFEHGNTSIMDDNSAFEVTPETGSGFAIAVADNKIAINKNNADTVLNGLLIAGNTYRLHEVTAPRGYALMNDVTFTVGDGGSVTVDAAAKDYVKVISADTDDMVEIAVADRPIEITVQKNDAANVEVLAGAQFELKDKDGNVLEGDIATGADGKLTIANRMEKVIFVQGETYTLTETKAPDNHILTDPAPTISFVVNADGTVTFIENDFTKSGVISGSGTAQITVTNEKTKLYLNKIDNETGERLKGVELQILQGEEVVAEWTSNGTDSGLIEGRLITGTTYTLREKTPIYGYNSMQDVSFQMNTDNEVVLESNPENLVNITVPDDAQPKVKELTIQNVRIRGHVKLQKSVEHNKAGDIEQVEFDLYRQVGDKPDVTKDEKIAEKLATDANGIWTSQHNSTEQFTDIDKTQKAFSHGLTTGDYYFIETKATANTILDTETAHAFTIENSNQGAHGRLVEVTAINKHFGATVSITKLDPEFKSGEDGYHISGVEFSLSYVPEHKSLADKITVSGTTDADGLLTFTDLPKGHYELIETKAEGYDIADGKAFQATFDIVETDNGKTIEVNETRKDKITMTAGSWSEHGITNPRLLGSVTLHKADGEAKEALNGVAFKLMKEQTNTGFIDWLKNLLTGQQYEYVDHVSENLTGSKLEEDGQLTIFGLDWGTYKLVETKAKDGYSTADKGKDGNVAVLATTEFTIDRNGLKDIELNVDGHAFYNYQTLLKIQKNGTDGVAGLEGAVFTITGKYADETGTTVEGSLTAATDANGEMIHKGKLIGGETYTLHEEKAPSGYELITTDMEFTMNTDGTIEVKSGEVKEGNEGYRLTQNDFFGNVITAYDTPIEAGLEKAGEKDNLLNGAVFEVTPEAGSAFADGSAKVTLTDDNKKDGLYKLLMAGNTYRIHEKTAPAGYELTEDILITADAHGEISLAEASEKAEVRADKITLRIHDDKVRVTLAKEDADTKQPVGDETIGYAELSVTGIFAQADGTPDTAERTITLLSKDSRKLDGLLIAGNTYAVKETDAPKGYMLPNPAPETEIIVNADGTLAFTDETAAKEAGYTITGDKLTLSNKKITLSLTKADVGTKSEIEGRGEAVFKVTPEAGTFADGNTTEVTVTTAENGMDSLTGQLVAGDTYRMKELTAPKGYQLADEFTFTVDRQGKIQKISDSKIAAGENGTNLTVYDQTIDVKLRKVSTEDFGKENTSIMDDNNVFEVTPETGSGFAVAITDNKVTISSQNADTALNGMLVAGNTYNVHEKTAPMGYELAEDFTIKVNEDGSVNVSEEAETFAEVGNKDADVAEIVVADKPLSVKFLKRLAGDAVKEGIEGAKFTLRGKLADGTSETTFESQTEAVEFKALLVGGEQYTLTETAAPAGSMMPAEGTKEKFTFTFTMGEDGVVTDVEYAEYEHSTGISYEKETDTITFFNQPTALTIFKKGADTQGGTNDVLLAECTFDVTGVFAPDRYTKTEESGGFVKNIRNWFGSFGTKETAAKIETIRVTTTGEDGLDNALKGRLIVGETYTVKEITAPNGYQVGGSMTFQVEGAALGNDGSMKLQLEMKDTNGNYDISYDEDGNVIITQRDLPVEFKLRKLNEQKEPLKGAEFAVTGLFEKEEAESTRMFVSDADGYIDLSKLVSEYNEEAGNHYIYKIVEKTAPEGYQKVEGEIYLRLNSVDKGDGMHVTEAEVLYESGQTPEALKSSLNVTSQNGVEVLNIQNTKIPEEPQKPQEPQKPGTTHNGVQTGDAQNILLYVLALLGSTAAAFTVLIKRRRRSRK